MLSSKKLFELVINNNYDDLLIAIQNKKIDFKAQNRKNNYIIGTAIEYRSIECFELLINNISNEQISDFNVYQSGFYQALEYYGNAPNLKNKYFIEKLLNKNIKIDQNNINCLTENIVIFNEFSEYILNNNPEKYLWDVQMNLTVYIKIFNYCMDNNLLNDNIIKNIFLSAIKSKKEDIIILIKNSKYIKNVWNYCPNIIEKLYNYNVSNIILKFFVNLYNIEKPFNVNITTIINNIIKNQLIYHDNYYNNTKKNILYNMEKIDILLSLDIENFNFSDKINNKIKELISSYWTQNSWINKKLICILNDEKQIALYISIIIHFINKIKNYEMNISTIDIIYYDLMQKDKISTKHLLRGLKTLINELIKSNKIIPNELDFIKDDDTIIPIELIKIKKKN